MNSIDNNNQSQRLTSYRAVIPFYILYDLDLNANHLRLYGQIEQMESNPNPAVNASFSYTWLGDQLGMNRRNARKTAKTLIDKGYIEHTEITPGKYRWNTKKAEVVITDTPEIDQNSSGGGRSETPGGVAQRPRGGVAQRPSKIPKDKIPKDKGKTLVDFDKSTSYKDDELFMRFYRIFPNKQKPDVARKAFYKHKPDEEFVKMLVDDVSSRANNNWKNRPKSKIPHPSTYLNAKEWEGEIYSAESNITQFPKKSPRYTMDELTVSL